MASKTLRRSARLTQAPHFSPTSHEIVTRKTRKPVASRRDDGKGIAVQSQASGSRRTRGKADEKEKRGVKRKRAVEAEDEEALPPSKALRELETRRASLDRLSQDLEEKRLQIEQREKAFEDHLEATGSPSIAVTKEHAEDLLKKLHNTCTCALCVDVLACPYLLTPARCGHTFCALCIVEYIRAKTTAVGDGTMVSECPICRADLLWGSGVLGKLVCPLTPNRLADEMLSDVLNALTTAVMSASPDATSTDNPSKSRKGKGKGRQPKARNPESAVDWDPEITGWLPGGTLRLDWEKRNRKGRTEIKAMFEL